MVASEFLDYIDKLQQVGNIGVEDVFDQLSFFFTVMLLLLCTLVVTVKQYLLTPIACYFPVTPSGIGFENYVVNYCWVQGTYPIPVDAVTSHIGVHPNGGPFLSEATQTWTENTLNIMSSNNVIYWKEMEKNKNNYYQWVPFILALQAMLFYIPRLAWQILIYNRTGTDISNLVSLACEAMRSDPDKRAELTQHVAKQLEMMILAHREYRKSRFQNIKRRVYHYCFMCLPSKRMGTTLVFGYLCIKFCYLLNALGQLFLMQKFLKMGTNYSFFYGYEVLMDIAAGRNWQYTMIFPRVAFCRVPYKTTHVNLEMGQCALPVNMLNEKIYIFLWFWIFLIALLTALSIPLWCSRIARLKIRRRFIRRFLRLANCYDSKNKNLVNRFIENFLRHDGNFILKMMQMNAGDIVTGEVTVKLYNIFKERYQDRDMYLDYNYTVDNDNQPMVLLAPDTHQADIENQHVFGQESNGVRRRPLIGLESELSAMSLLKSDKDLQKAAYISEEKASAPTPVLNC